MPTIADLSATLGQFNNLAGPTNAVTRPGNTVTRHAETPQGSGPADRLTFNDDNESPDTGGATDHQRPTRTRRHPNPPHHPTTLATWLIPGNRVAARIT
ncbi:hypothetical protein [Mycobacterium marinum]|uniref:hypothetical protein n=1 Tax=Mycobacterium marinum TaxID=1781 RepID=UPI00307A559C